MSPIIQMKRLKLNDWPHLFERLSLDSDLMCVWGYPGYCSGRHRLNLSGAHVPVGKGLSIDW